MSKKINFTQEHLEQQRREELRLLSDLDRQTQGVLRELQYIAEIIETHKTVAPVEEIRQKIRSAYQRIKAQLSDEPAVEQNAQLSSGLALEPNPLVEDMGGMPLESISSEWQELVEGQLLDKAELENLVKDKLKSRAELANRLRAKHQPAPAPRVAQQYTPKFKDIEKTLKYIIKEMPPPPVPQPAPPSKPRPFGF